MELKEDKWACLCKHDNPDTVGRNVVNPETSVTSFFFSLLRTFSFHGLSTNPFSHHPSTKTREHASTVPITFMSGCRFSQFHFRKNKWPSVLARGRKIPVFFVLVYKYCRRTGDGRVVDFVQRDWSMQGTVCPTVRFSHWYTIKPN